MKVSFRHSGLCADFLLNPSLTIATSGLDPVTERKIHEVIQRYFRQSTIIAVMHKLELTVSSIFVLSSHFIHAKYLPSYQAEFDKVLVLDHGSVAAFDSPKALVERMDDHYSSMLGEAGLLDYVKMVLSIG